MQRDRKIRVGITHGDINGIGYEVIMKALADERIPELCTPVVFGSGRLFSYFKDKVTAEGFVYSNAQSADKVRDGVVNLVNVLPTEMPVELGHDTKASGEAALLSLQAAVEALKNGYIDVLVTAPISKHAMQSTGCWDYAGHTEYLEHELGDDEHKALMIMCNEAMRMALVTTHVPLAEVPTLITEERVYDYIKRLNRALKEDFALEAPRIAVLSLNPHNGEQGMLGQEEQTAILPAVNKAFAEGIFAFGPYPADGFFGAESYTKFDGVLAMYHDQGLTPFKLMAGSTGVNFTAGLKYVRTSPDHGTGYDIAGLDRADEQSMRNAIYTAIDIFRNRDEYGYIHRNPLRKQYVDRSGDRTTIDLSKEETEEGI